MQSEWSKSNIDIFPAKDYSDNHIENSNVQVLYSQIIRTKLIIQMLQKCDNQKN